MFPIGKPVKRTRFTFGSVSFFDSVPRRVAVVVSKKVARRAVDRNKIRRRITNALRPHLAHLPLSVVVYPTKEVLRAPYQELALLLAEACTR